jgi:hypothetical protein
MTQRDPRTEQAYRLSLANGISVIVTIVCVLVAFMVIDSALEEMRDDARLINVAGRQRMLSQNIALAIVASHALPNAVPWNLSRRMDEFRDGHMEVCKGLRRDSLYMDGHLMTVLTGPVQESIDSLIASARMVGLGKKVDPVQVIKASARVLEGMDRITFGVQQVSQEKRTRAERTIAVTLLVLVLVVILEFMVIMRPALQRHQTLYRELEVSRENAAAAAANLRQIVRIIPDITFVFDADGRYKDIFTYREDLLVQDRRQLIGKTISEVFPEHQVGLFMTALAETLSTGTSQEIHYALELPTRTRWFEGVTTVLDYPLDRRKDVVMIVRDVTERHERDVHEQHMQRRLIQAALEAQEAERERLADDLHDGLGQRLAALKLNASRLECLRDNDDTTSILGEIDDLTETVREIATNIAPATLRRFGLPEAIRTDASQFVSPGSLAIHVHLHTRNGRYPETVEKGLFRIYQELITNVIRHAQATEVTIQLLERDGLLELQVEDNGRGFNEPATTIQGRGLIGVQTRAIALHGTLHVDSVPNRGTYVSIVVPISERRHDDRTRSTPATTEDKRPDIDC